MDSNYIIVYSYDMDARLTEYCYSENLLTVLKHLISEGAAIISVNLLP